VTGGFVAAATSRHDRVAAAGLLGGAALLALVAAGTFGNAIVLPALAAVGFLIGATGPSRDLIVRNATPRGAAGRVYGFVYSGLDLGATLAPALFGLMLDHGLAREMFFLIAALYVVAIATVVSVRRTGAMPAAAA
jgi:MFS family permease